jgi:hypothetical protein
LVSSENLFAQALRATHARIAALIKAIEATDLSRQADAPALPDCPCGPNRGSEPKRPGGAKVGTVISPVNLHGPGEASRASHKIAHACGSASALHLLDAIEGLESAQQYPCADAGLLARYVHHERGTVHEKHIAMTMTEKQGMIPRRFSAKRVAGGITGRIAFRLDNAPAPSAGWKIMNQRLSDEISRQLEGIYGQLLAAKTPNAASTHG